MMGMGAGQSGVVRMRLCVIPGYFVCVVPQLIPIIFNHNRPLVKRQALFEGDPISLGESNLTLQGAHPFTPSYNDQRGPLDGREPLLEGINEFFVITERLEWVHVEPFFQ